MKISHKILSVACALAAGVVAADDSGLAVVSDESYVALHNAFSKKVFVETATNGVQALTLQQDETYPTSVGQPAFWLDCSDTTGWQSYEDDGATYVTNIPSKAGSKLAGTRALTTQPGGGDWTGWNNGATKPKPPAFIVSETVFGKGGYYLDFGEQGSGRALLFSTDESGRNALTGIGTVIAVFGTDADGRNGGHFFGGGAGSVLYGWNRAADVIRSSSTYAFSSCLFDDLAQDALKTATVWHDGNVAAPLLSGYVGDWEVLSLRCASAAVQASGLGIGDKRYDKYALSGGMEIAELLVYDTVLTREAIEKVEVYLERKWLDRERTRWNGKARVGEINAFQSNFKGNLDVPAGETLEVDRLVGGMRISSMAKNGAGTLVLAGEGAQAYNSEFVFNDGTISFPELKATPTAATLPAHLYARFDASELTSVSRDGEGRVSMWNNLSTDTDALAFNRTFALRQNITDHQPNLLVNELGTGLNVLDFGENVNDGAFMVFSTNTAVVAGANPSVALSSIQMVVAFLGVMEGGGALFDSATFQRLKEDTHDFRCAVTNTLAAAPKMWHNGRPWDPARGYETPGYQVVAFQTVGGAVSTLMKSFTTAYCGGARVGEILIWNRSLTETEVCDAQAYLMAKWLGRSTPGYERPATDFVAMDLQQVTVTNNDVTIHVGAGRTVRIGTLTARSEVKKTGEGTLEIEQASFLVNGRITTMAGAVTSVGARDVDDADTLAPGASLHLDASDTTRLYTKVRSTDKTTRVVNWRDANDKVGAWCPYGPANLTYAPRLTSEAEGCNGKSVVDFGVYAVAADKAWMPLDRPLRGLREIYAVINYHGRIAYNLESAAVTDDSGVYHTTTNYCVGFLLGNSDGRDGNGSRQYYTWYPWVDSEEDISFHNQFGTRYIKVNGAGKTLYWWNGNLFGGYNAYFGGTDFVRTNGVSVYYNQIKVATNVFQLVEAHPSRSFSAGGIALDRASTSRMGGFAIAELVAYEHPLSERERVATRNYLMRKWLQPSYEDALPDPPEKSEIVEHDVTVDGAITLDAAEDVARVNVQGEGTFTKTGAGTLTVQNLSTLDGTVNVAEGTLKVLYGEPYATPYLPENGIIYHADATRGITAVTNANNKVCVSTWESQTDDRIIAVADSAHGSNTPELEQLVWDEELGYKPVVKIFASGASFVWKDANGAAKHLSNIRSAFWMIGSQEGGGFLMGGGEYETVSSGTAFTCQYAWHRGIYEDGGNVGSNPEAAVLHSGADPNLRSATWWRNNTVIPSQTHVTGGLSGHWDQISMIVKDDDSPANADGLAYDGRSKVAPNYYNSYYNGRQRLAELICYDRRVTDEERQQIECYLRCKWLNNMHAPATQVTVNVAEGATLDLGDNAQTFAGLTGGGTIAGSVTAGAFTVDVLQTDRSLTVSGILTVTANPVVTVENLTSRKGYKEILIATAADVEGVENLANATITGVPAGVSARLSAKDGKLVLRLGRRGLMWLFRKK